MGVDDSFKQPGAVPFKWEIQPGVPKHHHQRPLHPLPPAPSFNQSGPVLVPVPVPVPVPFKWEIKPHPGVPKHHHQRPLSPSPPNLKPPPARSYFFPCPDPPPRSILASPRSRSDRLRFHHSALLRTEVVSSGCFPSHSSLYRSGSSKKAMSMEAEYSSDLESLPRWKSSTPFRQSASLSSSPRVCRSSPGPGRDSEWAGFGLF